MRNIREITVGDHAAVRVKELTVGEIRAWIRCLAAPAGAVDVAGEMLFSEVRLDELAMMVEGIDDGAWTPSELRQVLDVARELNPDFFDLRGRILKLSPPSSVSETSTAPAVG